MSKATLILGILVAALQLANHVSSQPVAPTYAYGICRSNMFGTYTTNSAYEDNLKTVLSDLQQHASASTFDFYNSSAGRGASTVYAQYSCRLDLTVDFCSQCIQEASLVALNCSNAKGAVIWYDECTLRYASRSMYGLPEDDFGAYVYLQESQANPAEFSGVLSDTVTGLIQEAGTGTGFATAEKTLSDSSTAYFLVDCSSDLTGRQCESCLTVALNQTQTCCGEWPVMLYSFLPSCQVMYNTVQPFFFSRSAAPSPPTTSATPPPSPPTKSGTPPPSPPTMSATPPPSPPTKSATPPPPPPTTSATPPPPPPPPPFESSFEPSPTVTIGSGGSAAVRRSENMKFTTIITMALVVLMLVLRA